MSSVCRLSQLQQPGRSPPELPFPLAPRELGAGCQTRPASSAYWGGMLQPASPAKGALACFLGAKGQDFSSDSTFLFYLLLVSLRTWPDKAQSEQSISAGATTKTWLD